MNSTLIKLAFIFALFGFIRWIAPAGSVGRDTENELVVKERTGSVDMEKYKTLQGELRGFYSGDNTVGQNNIKMCEFMMQSVDNYIQRYVSLFLIMSNLLDYEIKDPNEKITVDLEVSITGEELAYLQGYSKSLKNSAFPKNLSKLDAILSKIARLKEKSFKKKVWSSLMSFLFSTDYYSIFSNPSFYRVFSFTLILTVIWTFRRSIFSKSLWTFLLVTINSTIIWEGLVLYWKEIKETDIKLYVETMQMRNLAEECKPENLRWYHSITNFFWQSKCIHYYQTLAKNAEEDVSLLRCIVDTYAFYLARAPIKLFGTSIRDFTQEISASLPYPINVLTVIPLSVLFVVVALFFILLLYGKRLRLSFLGAAIEVGDVKAERKNETPAVTGSERATPIRKLKPWTKSRVSKNWVGDCGKRWKLTASKCTSEVPHKEGGSNINGSSGALISNEMKQD